jgi:hypothetical protein
MKTYTEQEEFLRTLTMSNPRSQTPRKEICLYDLDRLGLILLEPSGAFYYNQVCGHSCLQNFAEGIFSYIRDDGNALYKIVSEYVLYKSCLTPEDADFLDSQFVQSADATYLRVDRNRLDDSIIPEITRLAVEEYSVTEEKALDMFYTSATAASLKDDKIAFTSLSPWPGNFICAEGFYREGDEETGTGRRAAIFIGPEFGTVTRPDLIEAAREAAGAGFELLIACWFIDTDYYEESFFVRHAYFLGANDPYGALKTSLKAEINAEAWESLHSDVSRPFSKPASGRIAIKVINHLGDEVMKVINV